MLKCPSCGSDVPQNANWCPQCGYGSTAPPTRSTPMIALFGALIAALVLTIFFIVGKPPTERRAEGVSSPPSSSLAVGQHVGTEGPFEVFVSERETPSLRIGNASEIVIVFAMENANGERYPMRIRPFSDNVMEVPVGTYRAEVSDPRGIVRSAKGTANLQSHREYRADFDVGSGPTRDFYIGD